MTVLGPLRFSNRRLDGNVVLVIGASTGIGAAAARRFATEGAKVVLTARRAEAVAALACAITESHGQAVAVACDVRDEQSVETAVTFAVERFGRLDGAFNNAGIVGSGATMLHQLSADKLASVLQVNFQGVALAMKHELRVMLANGGGAIVNNSTVATFRVRGRSFDYAASKSAVNNITLNAALAYAASGIRVNAVAPGFTATPMTETLLADESIRAAMIQASPLNVIAHPDDVAAAATYLLCEESRCITGVVLPIGGGSI
jgi:NAD(P)-dependent dehydrogenase (short-subunit alcohol dehydrogenase family)